METGITSATTAETQVISRRIARKLVLAPALNQEKAPGDLATPEAANAETAEETMEIIGQAVKDLLTEEIEEDMTMKDNPTTTTVEDKIETGETTLGKPF